MTVESPTDLLLVEAEPGSFQFSAYRNLHVLLWLQSPTVEVVNRVERAMIARNKIGEDYISAVHIVAPEARPPSTEARAAIVEMVQRRGEKTVCGAVVVERDGLLGLAVRSAVTGIVIVAPKHYRVKVFDTIEACAPWVSEQHEKVTQHPFDPDAILTTLRAARASAQ